MIWNKTKNSIALYIEPVLYWHTGPYDSDDMALNANKMYQLYLAQLIMNVVPCLISKY